MRRLSIVCIVVMLLLTGCRNNHTDEAESLKTYETFIEAINNNKGIESKIIPFDYKLNVFKQKDNSYQYEIKIFNPRVAMYNIKMIAVDKAVDANQNIYPCLGILGDDASVSYNMIPFQGNAELGFIKMIGLDSVSREKQFTLNVMVTWENSDGVETSRVFFNSSFIEEVNDTDNGQKATSDANSE